MTGVHKWMWAFLLVLVVKRAESKVGITKPIREEVVKRGSDGNLVCHISQLNKNVVHWYYLNDPSVGIKHLFAGDALISSFQRHKYDVNQTTVGATTKSVLTIRRTGIPDGGRYECVVQIVGEPSIKWPRKSGRLVVAIMPWIRSITSNAAGKVGGNVTLECTAAGKPTPKISWHRKNGNPIPGMGVYGNDSVYEYKGSTLTLRNLQKGDQGIYVCTAINDINTPAFGEAMLNVLTEPRARALKKFEMEPQGVYASANLECIIGGTPRPTMTWYKTVNDYQEPLSTGSDYSIESIVSDNAAYGLNGLTEDEVLFRLHIIDVDPGDYGEYTCQAVNPYGQASDTVRLLEEDGWAYNNQGRITSAGQRIRFDMGIEFMFVIASAILCILRRI